MVNTLLTTLNRAELLANYAGGFWRSETIYGRVHEHMTATPGKVAIRESMRVTTYAGLIAGADALAGELAAAGLRPGDRVAVWLPSRAETAMAILACSRGGYVGCPSLHRQHTSADVATLVDRMRAQAVIAEKGYGADRATPGEEPTLTGSHRPRLVKLLHPAGAEAPHEGTPPTLDAPRTDPDTVVYLAFTSGTTGRPKGVMHSDNTLLAATRAMAADWSIGSDSVVYSFSPMSHNLGFGAMLLALTEGGELVVHDVPKGASLASRLHETGATFAFGVPTHAMDLVAELRAPGAPDVSALRGFRISGASVPPHLATELMHLGIAPQTGFGMTEAGSHHYTRPQDPPERVSTTSGRPIAGYEVRIVSGQDPDLELGPGEMGQITGRGASLMLGYFGDQEATEDAFTRSGWFLTGDLGFVDDEGYLHVTGRVKDVIIRGGHNIYPALIENLTTELVDVDKAAAVPVPDERLGERVCLVVSSRDGSPLDKSRLLEHLRARGLSRFDMPEFFLQLEDMPLTPSGKVLKRAVADAIADGHSLPEPVATRA
ncbi:MAG: hypothetical protein JWR45_712 [Blastococcus sp.]|nr:hypothetical protein [Blastococcus sp.]